MIGIYVFQSIETSDNRSHHLCIKRNGSIISLKDDDFLYAETLERSEAPMAG